MTTLNLAGNQLYNSELPKLIPGESTDFETRKFPVGMKHLRNLALDFNPLDQLWPLGEFEEMERLSFDGTNQAAKLAQVPDLTWPTTSGGAERGLEFLSLDNTAATGLFATYFRPDPEFIGNPASVTDFDAMYLGRYKIYGTIIGPTYSGTDGNVNFASTTSPFNGHELLTDNFLARWAGKQGTFSGGPQHAGDGPGLDRALAEP